MSILSVEFELEGFATTAFLILAGVTVKAAVLLGAVAILDQAMSRTSAGWRHLIWTGTLGGSLLLPGLFLALPAWRILPHHLGFADRGLLQSDAAVAVEGPRVDALASDSPSSLQPVAPVRGDGIGNGKHPIGDAGLDSLSVAIEPGERGGHADRNASFSFGTWAILACGIWAAGAAFCILRLLAACARLHWLRRNSEPVVEGDLASAAKEIRRELGIARNVELLRGARQLMPLTWGIFKPKIALPPEAANWTADQCRAVLLHELAHIRRHDCLSHLVAQLACACYWFNPLVWFAKYRLSTERERACDDLVLLQGMRPSDYAEHIVYVGANYRVCRQSAHATAGMARPSEIERRVRSILDQDRVRWSPSNRTVAAALVIVCLASMLFSALRATTMAEEPPAAQPAPLTDSERPAPVRFGGKARFQDQASLASFTLAATDRLLVSATTTGQVTVWDTAKGTPVFRLDNAGQAANVVAVSPNGKLLAAGSTQFGDVRVWSLETGEKLASFNGLPGAEATGAFSGDMAFSPDNSTLATAGHDGRLRLWEAVSGKAIREMPGHGATVTRIAFTSDGSFVASSGFDGTVRLWDAASGDELNRWSGNWPQALCVAVMPGDKTLAVATACGLVLLDLETRIEIPLDEEQRQPLFWLAIADDGQSLVGLARPYDPTTRKKGAYRLMVYDPMTWKITASHEVPNKTIRRIELTKDGKFVALSGYDESRVRFWNVKDGQERYPPVDGHNAPVGGIGFADDGHTLFTTGGDGTRRTWDVSTGKQKLVMNKALPWAVATAKGNRIVTGGGWSNPIYVRDLETGHQVARFELTPKVKFGLNALAISADGENVLAVAVVPNEKILVRGWSLDSGQVTVTHDLSMKDYLDLDRLTIRQPSGLAFSPDGKLLAIAGKDQVHLFDNVAGKKIGSLPRSDGFIRQMRFLSENKFLVLANDGKGTELWDLAAKKLVRKITSVDDENGWTRLAASADGRYLLTATQTLKSETIQIWTTDGWEKVFERRGNSMQHICFAFSPGGKHLAVGRMDGTAELWEFPADGDP